MPAPDGLMIECTSPLANTCRMPREPEPPKPTSWDIYKVATKAVRLGTVEAPDKSSAIDKAAQEFKAEAWCLYAVPRR